jgi:hypothetical protein
VFLDRRLRQLSGHPFALPRGFRVAPLSAPAAARLEPARDVTPMVLPMVLSGRRPGCHCCRRDGVRHDRSALPDHSLGGVDGRVDFASECWRPGVADLLAYLSVWLSRRGACSGSADSHPRQQSKTDQQISFRNRWSSRTRSRTASGSCSRCQRHSNLAALSPSCPGAAARTALMA